MDTVSHLPFSALVGLDVAQQALLLLAVEPRLCGVVLAARAGTGKSSLARGIRALLDVPFIEIPATVSVENLVGGMNLEATLRKGKTVMQPGLLTKANGGIGYVDGINLLNDDSANTLLSVLDEGTVHVEREGISKRLPAKLCLLASYDPAEGIPRHHLLDRIGLIINLANTATPEQRAEVVRNNLLNDPHVWEDDTDFLRGLILAARTQLPNVHISDAYVTQLSQIAMQYGVEGHRVDLFAMYASRAAAALSMRDEVIIEDLELAARLVILPRATQLPQQEPEEEPPPPPEPPQDQNDNKDDDQDPSEDDEWDTTQDFLSIPPEQLLEALASDLPDELDDLEFSKLRRGKSGSRGKTTGKRGRHIRSLPGNPNHNRIDVAATLRAAAPWQPVRNQSCNGHKTYRVSLRPSDIRVKQYQSKAGALFCLAVDASGSMALHRMRQAKGAIHCLLQKAYVNRDQVSLIAFRGEKAELLLPPSQSVELARRALDSLPTGGGTPLASALLMASDVAEHARQRGILQTVLIALTDGRGNVSIDGQKDPQEELEQLGQHFDDCNIHTVIVDTKRNYLSRGEARQLADWLGGDYAYLPNASGEQIAALATDAVADR